MTRSALPPARIPYYLNGRPHQRALILGWLEESHGSKEPVDLKSLTIEHVMPQSSTDEWEQAVSRGPRAWRDFRAGARRTGAHARQPDPDRVQLGAEQQPVRRQAAQLAKSGLAMNQDIAAQSRWGRPQILARADALAERVITMWPGPPAGAKPSTTVAWNLMNPPRGVTGGPWTTYGDIAAIIGSHSAAVSTRLATVPHPTRTACSN